MTLEEAIAARYERQVAERAAAELEATGRKPRSPGDPEPVSLYAAVGAVSRRLPGVVWPTPASSGPTASKPT